MLALMWRSFLFVLLLAGCGTPPEQLVTVAAGVGIGSITILHRTPFDALWSLITGKDCSAVRMDRGETYCRPEEPPPAPPPFCTMGLGAVDCWTDPALLNHPTEVADGPRVLTPAQEANRTRTWP